jgi:hypothetical protein
MKQKSPEVQQAQLASFAEEGLDFYHDQKAVFEEGIESGDAHDLPQSHMAANGNLGKTAIDVLPAGFEMPPISLLPEGERRLTDYLRGVGGARHNTIARRTELLGAFKKFQPILEGLEETHIIGRGDKCRAYLVEDQDTEYIVRKTHSNKPRPFIIEGYVRGCMRAEGIPHLEQIAAVSYDKGIIVTERMPGKKISDLTPEDKGEVSDAQLEQLVDTLVAAQQAGVSVDLGNGDNLLYDTEEGFGMVDLDVFQETLSMYDSLPGKLSSASSLLGPGLAARFQRIASEHLNLKE